MAAPETQQQTANVGFNNVFGMYYMLPNPIVYTMSSNVC